MVRFGRFGPTRSVKEKLPPIGKWIGKISGRITGRQSGQNRDCMGIAGRQEGMSCNLLMLASLFCSHDGDVERGHRGLPPDLPCTPVEGPRTRPSSKGAEPQALLRERRGTRTTSTWTCPSRRGRRSRRRSTRSWPRRASRKALPALRDRDRAGFDAEADRHHTTVEDGSEGEASGASPFSRRIEFSRRESNAESVLGPVATPIADSYGSSPFSASHCRPRRKHRPEGLGDGWSGFRTS